MVSGVVNGGTVVVSAAVVMTLVIVFTVVIFCVVGSVVVIISVVFTVTGAVNIIIKSLLANPCAFSREFIRKVFSLTFPSAQVHSLRKRLCS